MNGVSVAILGMTVVCTTLFATYFLVSKARAGSHSERGFVETQISGKEVPLNDLKLIPMNR